MAQSCPSLDDSFRAARLDMRSRSVEAEKPSVDDPFYFVSDQVLRDEMASFASLEERISSSSVW